MPRARRRCGRAAGDPCCSSCHTCAAGHARHEAGHGVLPASRAAMAPMVVGVARCATVAAAYPPAEQAVDRAALQVELDAAAADGGSQWLEPACLEVAGCPAARRRCLRTARRGADPRSLPVSGRQRGGLLEFGKRSRHCSAGRSRDFGQTTCQRVAAMDRPEALVEARRQLAWPHSQRLLISQAAGLRARPRWPGGMQQHLRFVEQSAQPGGTGLFRQLAVRSRRPAIAESGGVRKSAGAARRRCQRSGS